MFGLMVVGSAEDNVWLGSVDGLASNPSNWSLNVTPDITHTVVFDGSQSVANCTWDEAASFDVAGWNQMESYTGTVTVETYLEATDTKKSFLNIHGSCTINGGIITHTANTSKVQLYRLGLSIDGDLTVGASGQINANAKGGPAWTCTTGSDFAIHAGSRTDISKVYGNVKEPVTMGNGEKLPGGGAIYILVAGNAVVDGKVVAMTRDNKTSGSWDTIEGGAGGSIYIKAASLTGSGIVDVSAVTYDRSRPASGGRIALIATVANEIGISTNNICATGSLGPISAAAGTIFLKTANQANGTLYIKNLNRATKDTCGILPVTKLATTPIPIGETWTFDEIVFDGSGILSIPEGSKLVLPNGFASISGSVKLSTSGMNVNLAGILYDGGEIDAIDLSDATIQNGWIFQADKSFIFPGNVTVKSGAAIGNLFFTQKPTEHAICDVTVNGNLTVESTGWIYSKSGGITQHNSNLNATSQYFSPGRFTHAGTLGLYRGTNVAYGSIFNPNLPGTFGSGNDTASLSLSGGVVKLAVGNDFVLDGRFDSSPNGDLWNGMSAGSGGSINITAGKLLGNGLITANGRNSSYNKDAGSTNMNSRGRLACGAGGRVSIRLTNPTASIDEFGLNKITSIGGDFGSADLKFLSSSGGTVYVQNPNDVEGAGTIYVTNINREDNVAETAIPAAYEGDAIEAFAAKPKLDISKKAIVLAGMNGLIFSNINIESGSKINLAGNTWSTTGMKVAGEIIAPGMYLPSDLPDVLFDTSEEATGVLKVLGANTLLIFR